MNRTKELDLTIHLVESLSLALLTLCLSLPFALLFRDGPFWADLTWGVGTILPVQLIREFSERIENRKKRVWLCLGVTALAVLIPITMMRRVYYLICCLPILLAGLVLGRPNGKLVLSVPRAFFPLTGLMLFAFGKISELPFLSAVAVCIVVLQILDYLLYRNQTKLRAAIYEDRDGRVSVESIISQNRKLIAGFLLLSVISVALIAYLMKEPPQTSEDALPYVNVLEQRKPQKDSTKISPEDRVYEFGDDEKWNFEVVERVIQIMLYLLVAFAILLAVVAVVFVLRNLNNDREKHNKPKENQFVVEQLSRKKHEQALVDEGQSTYDKRIRRRYSRRILQTVTKKGELAHYTPTELENAAGLPESDQRRVIHRVYTKARYGSEPSTREDYLELKDALRRLEKEAKAQ